MFIDAGIQEWDSVLKLVLSREPPQFKSMKTRIGKH